MAALMVLLQHLATDFLASLQSEQYDSIFLAFITNGHFAIVIFFVLSGYALSLSQIRHKQNLLPLFIARYFRLMLPILFTSTITYIFLVSGLFLITGNAYQFTPSIPSLLQFSLFDVFFDYQNSLSYSPQLWTITNEIIGSYVIYALIPLFRKQFKFRLLFPLVVAVTLLYFKPFIACFIFGYLITELNLRCLGKSSKLISIASLLAFVSVVGMVTMSESLDDWIKCLLASALIISVSYSPILRKVFTNSILLFIGKISFPLYLIQFLVICSFSAYLNTQFKAFNFVNLTSTNINLGLTIVACILFAYLLTPLDTYSIQVSKKIWVKFPALCR
jgi:peptidoglycan/LPS O-acetylase OafA/YrhL